MTSAQGSLAFDVAAEVPSSELNRIQSGIDFAQAYLAEFLGGDIPASARQSMVVKVVATGQGLYGGCCASSDEAGRARPFFDVGHPGWTSMNELDRQAVAAHEYTHGLQIALGCAYGPRMAWFTEGMAQFVGLNSLVSAGLLTSAEARQTMLQRVSQEAVNLGLQGLEYRGQQIQVHPGPLGYLAIEFLVSLAPSGLMSLRTYCVNFAASPESAFAEAFGVSLPDFYLSFSAHLNELR